MKKAFTFAFAVAVTFAALLTVVPSAHARRGADDAAPPECQVEDGGIVVCR